MRFAQAAVRVWGCQMDFAHPFDSVYKVQSGDTVETTGVRQDQGGKIWCELAGGGWIEESLLTVIE